MRILLFLSLWLLALPGYSQQLVPQPAKASFNQSRFIFSKDTRWTCKNLDFLPESLLFGQFVKERYQWITSSSLSKKAGQLIRIEKISLSDTAAYKLKITPKLIILQASGKAGVFYGFQTLLQLLHGGGGKFIPCGEIEDQPRFSWRGMHLDVCRHFFNKNEVKRYLDYLALYKMNVFHWHLTEDQGWRFPVKQFPKLATVSAWRNGSMVGHYRDQRYDSLRYGGIYTTDDIKEVIQYAAARHITIVPEIEMPGHALSALAAYPELSCTGGPFEVGKTWGVFDDVYCAGNDSVFRFLEQILDEVVRLFPGKYIHIGGDECPKTRWKTCPKCQKRMKEEGLKDEHELQSYFIRRIEAYLNKKGRQIIGWDEILEGGLAPNAAVMSWRGTEGGIAAAKQKHEVVMTPGSPCYFDHYQHADKQKEPVAIGGLNTLESVYSYEPIPSTLNEEEKKYVLGAQGNVWTEYINTFAQVEYMALPRMSALAEVLWSPAENRYYPHFVGRLRSQIKMLDHWKANYAKHFLAE